MFHVSRYIFRVGENEFGAIYQHKVNCVCTMKMCDTCKLTPQIATCSSCGGQRCHVFLGENALDEFFTFLFDKRRHNGWTAIAHNARSFDGQFVLDYLHGQILKVQKIIPKGDFRTYLL